MVQIFKHFLIRLVKTPEEEKVFKDGWVISSYRIKKIILNYVMDYKNLKIHL